MWGIGKTWLIEELRDRCLKDGRAIILYVSLVDMVPDADPTSGSAVSTRTKLRNLSTVRFYGSLALGSAA